MAPAVLPQQVDVAVLVAVEGGLPGQVLGGPQAIVAARSEVAEALVPAVGQGALPGFEGQVVAVQPVALEVVVQVVVGGLAEGHGAADELVQQLDQVLALRGDPHVRDRRPVGPQGQVTLAPGHRLGVQRVQPQAHQGLCAGAPLPAGQGRREVLVLALRVVAGELPEEVLARRDVAVGRRRGEVRLAMLQPAADRVVEVQVEEELRGCVPLHRRPACVQAVRHGRGMGLHVVHEQVSEDL